MLLTPKGGALRSSLPTCLLARLQVSLVTGGGGSSKAISKGLSANASTADAREGSVFTLLNFGTVELSRPAEEEEEVVVVLLLWWWLLLAVAVREVVLLVLVVVVSRSNLRDDDDDDG